MVAYLEGDLLRTDADIICHQVNLQGVMGGGLAWQIARKFPSVNEVYEDYTWKRLGNVCFADTDTFTVANCFSQNEDFTTNYDALRLCLFKVKRYMIKRGYTSVAIPYKYGCGIAKGDWNKVFSMFEKVFKDYDLLIYIK